MPSRRTTPLLVLVPSLIALANATQGRVISASFIEAESLDLTVAGTVDWAVFGQNKAGNVSLDAVEWRRNGTGAGKTIQVPGGPQEMEATPFTGVGWQWSDGTHVPAFRRLQGTTTRQGMRLWLRQGGKAVFEFGRAGVARAEAYVLFRCDGKARLTARQEDSEMPFHAIERRTLGAAVVVYDGDAPLALEIANAGKGNLCVRGFAVALGNPVRSDASFPRMATRQELAAREAEKLADVDFLRLTVGFADCMLRYGRDRYGSVHSPLFAVLLTREKEPQMGPYPLFASPERVAKDMNTPFARFDFNRCLNYPSGLGAEGPHKVTVFGCDPYEDQDLYVMLDDLTRITGESKYRDASHEALTWWFSNTQSPVSGLYPWGEHLGWDFENECPTYFAGPSKHLYAACYHEIKDYVPFLDLLAAIPAKADGELTHLERYALGVWNAHYWDPAHAFYCRHGDYTGADDREGSTSGFPAHQGAHLRLWVRTYKQTIKPDVKVLMRTILNTVLDAQIARAQRYGFIPFTFDADIEGRPPAKSPQSDRLGRHAAELSADLREVDPALSEKLRRLAELLLGKDGMERVSAARAGDSLSSQAKDGRPQPTVSDLSDETTPQKHADEIIRRIELFRLHGDRRYLDAACQQARLAYVRFLDDTCPLPRARSDGPLIDAAGNTFPDFYFRGARLMHAFALLGEAQREL